MGVRTNLLGVTLSGAEIAALQAAGEDGVGTLQFAQQKCADAIATLTAVINTIPAGSNKTTLQTAVTALT
jgi:hypothetical protein